MSEPYIAQVTMFAGSFAPRGWSYCNGQILPIAQHTALFSLLGTIYGGDGRSTFGLPDLRGRFPMHSGGNSQGPGLTKRVLGAKGGAESRSLSVAQLPAHGHVVKPQCAAEDADADDPSNKYPAVANDNIYHGTADSSMLGTTSENTGSGQAVDMMNPFLALNFLIAMTGLYPSRN